MKGTHKKASAKPKYNEKMKTKFKVIADYPNSNFTIGDIVEFNGVVYGMNEPQKFVRNPEKYPAIFKKLNPMEKARRQLTRS